MAQSQIQQLKQDVQILINDLNKYKNDINVAADIATLTPIETQLANVISNVPTKVISDNSSDIKKINDDIAKIDVTINDVKAKTKITDLVSPNLAAYIGTEPKKNLSDERSKIEKMITDLKTIVTDLAINFTDIVKPAADRLAKEFDIKTAINKTGGNDLSVGKEQYMVDIAILNKKYLDYINLYQKIIGNLGLDTSAENKINNLQGDIDIINAKIKDTIPKNATKTAYDFKSSTAPKTKFKDLNKYHTHLKKIYDNEEKHRNDPTNTALFTPTDKGPFTIFFVDGTGSKRTGLIKIFNLVIDELEKFLDEKFPKMLGGMSGGTLLDDIKNSIILTLHKQKLIVQIDTYIKILTDYFNSLIVSTSTSTSTNMNTSINTEDHSTLLRSLIALKMGSVTIFDVQLYEYCKSLGLSDAVVVAILFAERKEDVKILLNKYLYNHYMAINNIIRLRKLSENLKFKMNYGVHDEQINILMGKMSIWK